MCKNLSKITVIIKISTNTILLLFLGIQKIKEEKVVAAGTHGFQENQSDFHNYAQGLNTLLAQGAIFKELHIFLPAILCQGSESNTLGS